MPRFADPAEWSPDRAYEALTIVIHAGDSFTSRQAVPVGASINDQNYWLETGNFNSQIEAYRREVLRFDGRITQNASDIDSLEADTADLKPRMTAAEQDIDDLGQDLLGLDRRVSTNTTDIDALETRFPVNTANIADDAITLDKMADAARYALMRNNIGPHSKVVFIGDSYGRGVGGTDSQGWPYYVCEALRLTSYINVSNSGAGFVREGHSEPYGAITFIDQIDYAYNHMPAGMTPAEVTHVVIGGGYNDHEYSSTVGTAAFNAVRRAMTRFPNAVVSVIPLCCGDRPLTASYVRTYQRIANGAARAGAATTMEGVYWLCPYQLQASYGDQIHPNDYGYQIEGRYIATFLQGGSVWPNTDAWGSSDEGYLVVDDATAQGFRTGVQSGYAWFHGNFVRTGFGNLCTLPSYLRPQDTQYFYGFGYADTDHKGVVRFRVTVNGVLSAYTLDAGTRDDSLEYTFYVPMTMIPLGNVW